MAKKSSRRGLIPVTRSANANEPATDGKHQPVNTEREKRDRQQWYSDTGQGIRGHGTR